MNFFYSPSMLPVVIAVAVNNILAKYEVMKIRRIARERGISAKYVRLSDIQKG